jgi:hypothetical protein
MQNKIPRGILFLGGLNCFFSFLSLASLIGFDRQDFQRFLEAVPQSQLTEKITYHDVQFANNISLLIVVIFLVLSVGILMLREWGRRGIVYFAATSAIILLIASIMQPAMASIAIIQLIYPGILLFYFTNSKVENYFKKQSIKRRKNKINAKQ